MVPALPPAARRRPVALAALAVATLALAVVAIVALLTAAPAHHGAAGVQRDLSYGAAETAKLDVHRTGAGSAPRPAVMVIHGGGWIARDKADTAPIAERLAHAGFVAINVNFTLAAPGQPGFPRQLKDLRSALRFVRANAADLGIDPARIGAYGNSTGAHLAALLATSGRGPLSKGGRVRAAVSWGGVYRLRAFHGPLRFRQRIQTLLGCYPCPKRADAASPVRHVSRGDPAIMIVHSRQETIPLGQATRMAKRLKVVGVPHRLRILPGKQHLPLDSPKVFNRTISFLRNRLR